jgi:hypothetical protein
MNIQKKQDIETKIDDFIFNKLSSNTYEIRETKSKKLLTWNRLDLGFKLAYLILT